MLTVILIMSAGMLLGYILRSKEKFMKTIGKSTLWIILVLLFFMGVSVGSNAQVMNNLDTIGLRGLQLAVTALMGSVLLAWGVYVWFFKQKSSQHER